ncbi:MAG: ABC-2 type transport system permease protein [Cyclobacteriaceae bacterium]|jgi:ABC-2 type transport system permease protein
MGKIGLIISREYLSRVQKKSFVIMTLLGPFLFAAMLFLPAYLATTGGDSKTIAVIDDSGLFELAFENTEDTFYEFLKVDQETGKELVKNESFDGLLYIPNLDVQDPDGVSFYGSSNPSLSMMGDLGYRIENEIENIKLRQSGIDREVLDNLKVDIDINSYNLSGDDEQESSSIGASAIGYISSFMIYIFIFIYGAQCMRGVIEEKTSRIIEVVISSVRPFQLMMGKVVGIAGVGLTQFLLWILLSFGVVSAIGAVFSSSAGDMKAQQREQLESMNIPQDEMMTEMDEDVLSKVASALGSINIPLVVVSFLFFFLSGYLLYGALFAAIGSAVDSDADAQQFMLPVTIPLIISIVSLSAILNDPNGTLAFWLSMIPFTAPVVMMMRVPFGVPAWELILSMALMIGGFVFTIWVGSRIYRIGILMHGTKVNYKILAKWFMMKN